MTTPRATTRRIDLHVHSNASDGTDSPADVVREAIAAGLDVIALTDHDTVAGHAEALAAAEGTGLTVVPGAEISCLYGEISLHLLAYRFDPSHPPLARELELLRTDRVRRARAMVDRLAELGAPITWEAVRAIADGGAVGRPHIARAMVDAGVVDDVPAAFSPAWIADGGRAYVEKYSLDPARAIELVRDAGGVTVFAHPLASSRGRVVGDAAIRAFAAAGLDGVEVDHPDHDAEARTHLRALAGELGLLVTGSSDYHGLVKDVPLGANTTDPGAYDELMSRAATRLAK